MRDRELNAIIEKVKALPAKRQYALIVALNKQGIDITPYIPIQKCTNEDDRDIPLTYAQQRLWFLEKLEGNSAYYNIPRVLRLTGNLNVKALEMAFNEIISRHSILRTHFVEYEGQPNQVVKPKGNLSLKVELANTEEELKDICEHEALKPFDLSGHSLIRIRLVKRAEDDFTLLVTMHHSISDGWSLNVLFKELTHHYTNYIENTSSKLKPLPIQYSDFAKWQRVSMTDELLDKQLAYWKEKLSNVNAQLILPTDRARPAIKTYAGAHERFICPTNILTKLRQLSNESNTTLYVTLLSAFLVLLRKYTQQEDITIGTPVANRNRSEVEQLIGLFVNTIVLRNEVKGDQTFLELMEHVKTNTIDAFAHQNVPFELLVDALSVERSMSYSPLFQVMFVLQESLSKVNDNIADLSVSEVDYDFKIAKFDLTLELQETSDGLQGTFEYNTDLFNSETIKRLATHYLNLLEDILLHKGEKSVTEYQYLSKQTRNQILNDWCPATASPDRSKCLHELFETTCNNFPNNTAITYNDDYLTYQELNEKANRLAHQLIELGIKPDDLVGIYLNRSPHIVISILGVLKAGSAYVPIDPSSPIERVRFIMNDSNAKLLLTETQLIEDVDVDSHNIFYVDQHSNHDFPSTNIKKEDIDLSSCNLAYVIYTSGSTGKPKGVLVQHNNVNRLFFSTNEYFKFTEKDVWTMFHSFAFDFSVWEMWGAFLYGGRVIIVPKSLAQSLENFYELIVREGVTVLNQTPTVFEQLIGIDTILKKDLHLRYVIFGGEALNAAILRPWFDNHSDEKIRMINMYGITETTVHVTYKQISKQDVYDDQKSVIGKKIPDLSLYVLDDNLNPVPIGVNGRMFVGGAGVTRGYLNRPELTAERFIKNPLTKQAEDHLYDTGDLARWLPDGGLEFVGRADNQVKIRGFRIELGEIESQMLTQRFIDTCCVMMREAAPGNKMLVAYIIPSEKAPKNKEQLRTELTQSLSRELPDYMIPTVMVFLDSLPVTSNGKVDRKSLPNLDLTAQYLESYVAPKSVTEHLLVNIWAQLLNLQQEDISVKSNFFALGGHSLLITKLIAKLVAAGFHCTVRMVFMSHSLEELAKTIDEQDVQVIYQVPENKIPNECHHITPEMITLTDLDETMINHIVNRVEGGVQNIQDIYPLVPSQEGILFHHIMNPEEDPYVIPALFRFSTKKSLGDFIIALQHVIDRHDALRTGFINSGVEKPVQVVWRKATLSVEEITLPAEVDAEQQMRNMLAEPTSMNIIYPPLVKLKVAKQAGNDECYVLFYMHHLIEDATSLKLIFQEITNLILSKEDNLESPVPYRNFVAYTLHQLETNDAKAYFQSRLEDITETTAPFNIYDTKGNGTNIRDFRHSLPADLAEKIREHAKQRHISPASIFHAAWALVVGVSSRRNDVVFGTVLSGRLQGIKGVERMMGNFINTLPIRFSLNNRTVAETIEDADAELKELINYEQSSLIMAQSCSGVNNNASLFTAMLNYRHFEENQNTEDQMDFRDLGIEWLGAVDRTNYPIGMSIDDIGTEFSLNIQASQILSPESVYQYVESALTGIIDALQSPLQGDIPIMDINILPEDERDILLKNQLGENRTRSSELCLHELFEQQVLMRPDEVAVIYQDQSLSYGALNERADGLANKIRIQGITPETLIGIYLDRSFEMIVSVLGVLKAGGAYVPIDTSLPLERVEYIIKDACLEFIVTDDSNKQRIKEISSVQNILNVLDGEIEKGIIPSSNDLSTIKPNNIAYCIYTSGSTGNPKGVLIEHRGVARIVLDKGYFPTNDKTIMLQHMSMSFDVGSQEVLVTLLNGGRLVVFDGDSRDINQIVDCIETHKVNSMALSAAFLPAFAEAVRERKLSLNYLGVGGESFSVSDVKNIYQSQSEITIVNAYGPTENSIASTCYEIPRQFPVGSVIPIGNPVDQTAAYVVDHQLKLVPTGVVGELLVGGAGVARGYLNNQQLTEQRFIEHKFSPTMQSERMYRTGDLVRRRKDGLLEFIGRVDNQVKVRGYRIELGEIENALMQHDDVSIATVLAVSSENDVNKKLVAHVVPTTDALDKLYKESYLESLKRWTTVFQEQYEGNDNNSSNIDSDFVGWNSSYTGKAIPEEEMIEWVEGTVCRIKSLSPKHLLEVGCGTGLLLSRYGADCESVHAVDVSEPVLKQVQHLVERNNWQHVHLQQGDALHLPINDHLSFDTVVLNSVVQYFPSQAYLEGVIVNLIKHMKQGGKLFLGDIRNYDMMDEHLFAVENENYQTSISASNIIGRIHKCRQQESELLVSPSFFVNLVERIPEMANVSILVKKGEGCNEMLRYRYDVIFDIKTISETLPESIPEECWTDYSDAPTLRQLVSSGKYQTFGVSGIPNSRIEKEVLILRHLRETSHLLQQVDPSRSTQNSKSTEHLVNDIQEIYALAEQSGYICEATWSQDEQDKLDFVFSKAALPPIRARSAYRQTQFTNYPQLSHHAATLTMRLKIHLSDQLPSYMVPAIYVIADSFPVTNNGKIDKAALPKPDDSVLIRAKHVPPSSETEKLLCSVLKDLLEIDELSVLDNFFDMGGHSLIAARFVNRLEEVSGKKLPLRTVFESGTVEAMAKSLDTQSESKAIPLVARSYQSDEEVGLSLEQSDLWFRNANPEMTNYRDNVVNAYLIKGKVDISILNLCINALIQRHEMLRTSFIQNNHTERQKVNTAAPIELLVSRVSSEKELNQVCQDERKKQFDDQTGGLVRFYWFESEQDNNYFVMIRPWGLFDGWSTGILLRELDYLYQHYSANSAVEYSPVPIHYRDYSEWQKEVVIEKVLDNHKSYWAQQLDQPPRSQDMFAKHQNYSTSRSGLKRVIPLNISKDLSGKILSIKQSQGLTTYNILLSAFFILLCRRTGMRDIIVGAPTSTRNKDELDMTVGYFVNVVALRAKLNTRSTGYEYLKQIKTMVTEAFENNIIPYSQVKDLLRTGESKIEGSLFETMFNLINLPYLEEHCSSIHMSEVEITNPSTCMALSLIFYESEKSLFGKMEYNADIFDEETVSEYVDEYVEIIHQLIDHPWRSLDDLMEELSLEENAILS